MFEALLEAELAKLAERGALRRVQKLATGLTALHRNDYLGFADADHSLSFADWAHENLRDVRLTHAASGSALLGGWTDAHEFLVSDLKRRYGKDAMLAPSGWQAGFGVADALGRLLGKRLLILADRFMHASFLDGCKAALQSGARFARFNHNDAAHAKRLIDARAQEDDVVLISLESVYSMSGDMAPLEDFVRLKKADKRIALYVDDAHGLGVLGPQGAGAAFEWRSEIDLLLLTFGKAPAGHGAAVLGTTTSVAALYNAARSVIYSTGLSPYAAAHTAFTLQAIEKADHLRRKLTEFGSEVSCALADPELPRLAPGALAGPHIHYLVCGTNASAAAARERLRAAGFEAALVRAPTVAQGFAGLRMSLSAGLEPTRVEALREALKHLTTELRTCTSRP